jgi:ferritin-like metal-binding protein YciE
MITNMVEFFVYELRESFNAEKQLLDALPHLIAKAKSPPLRQCLEARLHVTAERVERLKEVFVSIGEFARERPSPVVHAFVRTGFKLIECDLSEEADEEVTDSALIALAQKVTHHGIAVYSTMVTWAKILDFRIACAVLSRVLQEERIAAEHWGELARREFEQPLMR